jgi:DNA-binding transcriptional LysR family regulator
MLGDITRDDWNDYRVFAIAARSGSFGAASRALRKTRQAVSLRVDSLEDRLGYKLLLRDATGVQLTRDGKRVLDLIERAETQLARTATIAGDPSDTIEGECRLALGDGMGTYWFPRFAAAFRRKHPRIALQTFTSTRRVMDKSPSHDILVQYNDTLDADLIAPRVATLHFMLFASRGYLEEHGTPRSIEDLKHHNIIDFTLPDNDRGMFATLRGFADRTVLIANAVATQCEAIRWDAGIGLLPSYAGFVHANLVPVIRDYGIAVPVHLCYEREIAKRPAVRATLKFLREVVFDRDRMPWFGESFVAPQEDWPALMKQCITRAAVLGRETADA